MAHRFHTAKKASTDARGYGRAHRAERARRVATTSEADRCGFCGLPLGSDRSQWHLPHNATRTGYLPGMWHARCNRVEGARRGGQRRMPRRNVPRAQSRAW